MELFASMNCRLLFSVVIPTYHRNDLLAKCLDCLAPGVQTLKSQLYEVIVTDDGSHTSAQQLVGDCYPWVIWIAGSCKGPAANRNNGAKYAQGEWLVFTDDDCLPDAQWLEAYAQAVAAEPGCLVFEGCTYVDRPRQSLAEISPVNEMGGYLWSCNFAIQRQLFESLRGFDERFHYATMEDVDLRLRLTKLGYSFSFIKAASVCHPWRYKGGWKNIKQQKESVLIYLSIHPEEVSKINYRYYLQRIARSFIKDIIPGIIMYKGKGLKDSLLEQISFLEICLYLFFKSKNLI